MELSCADSPHRSTPSPPLAGPTDECGSLLDDGITTVNRNRSVLVGLPAVDRDDGTVDERSLTGQQERGQRGDLSDLAEALHRVDGHELLADLLPVLGVDLLERSFDHRGHDRARGDGI